MLPSSAFVLGCDLCRATPLSLFLLCVLVAFLLLLVSPLVFSAPLSLCLSPSLHAGSDPSVVSVRFSFLLLSAAFSPRRPRFLGCWVLLRPACPSAHLLSLVYRWVLLGSLAFSLVALFLALTGFWLCSRLPFLTAAGPPFPFGRVCSRRAVELGLYCPCSGLSSPPLLRVHNFLICF